jgi:hypothetical protein
MNKKRYTIDEVCLDIINFEGLMPTIVYSDYKDITFYVLYSEVYPRPLDSAVGCDKFTRRLRDYLMISNTKYGHPKICYFIRLINNLHKSHELKRLYSRIFKRTVLISKGNPTVDMSVKKDKDNVS